MSGGYDKFFKTAKAVRSSDEPARKTAAPRPAAPKAKSEPEVEAELRKMFKMSPDKSNKKTKKASTRKKDPGGAPWMSMGLSCLAVVLSAAYLVDPVLFSKLFNSIEIKATAAASASTGTAKNSAPKVESAAKSSPVSKSETGVETAPAVSQDVSYISRLTERNKELDTRERELNELEEELQRQRAEVEVQIKRLEDMRRQIASVLNERVEMDEEKVNRLVEVYSNMKPQQAAEIISTLNEDLAVEVLGRMKKNSAAGILNLMEAKKAQTLSEKYTGYAKSR